MRSLSEGNNFEGFIKSHQLPADRLVMDAAASDLPDAHDRVPSRTDANSVGLDNPHKPIIPNF